jgi:hypothetical protein
LFSLFMVTAGVGTTICIGSIFGAFMTDGLFDKENNSQVSSRINPALTDLLGALATGTVGAIALVNPVVDTFDSELCLHPLLLCSINFVIFTLTSVLLVHSFAS